MLLVMRETFGDHLRIRLTGRMDAASLDELNAWTVPEGIGQLEVDLAGCEYVSSAGLRTFMRWHRLALERPFMLSVTGVNAQVYDVFELTGLNRLMDVRRRAREVSIEGLELLSAGVCGQCFRLDAETVLTKFLSIGESGKHVPPFGAGDTVGQELDTQRPAAQLQLQQLAERAGVAEQVLAQRVHERRTPREVAHRVEHESNPSQAEVPVAPGRERDDLDVDVRVVESEHLDPELPGVHLRPQGLEVQAPRDPARTDLARTGVQAAARRLSRASCTKADNSSCWLPVGSSRQ